MVKGIFFFLPVLVQNWSPSYPPTPFFGLTETCAALSWFDDKFLCCAAFNKAFKLVVFGRFNAACAAAVFIIFMLHGELRMMDCKYFQ